MAYCPFGYIMYMQEERLLYTQLFENIRRVAPLCAHEPPITISDDAHETVTTPPSSLLCGALESHDHFLESSLVALFDAKHKAWC